MQRWLLMVLVVTLLAGSTPAQTNDSDGKRMFVLNVFRDQIGEVFDFVCGKRPGVIAIVTSLGQSRQRRQTLNPDRHSTAFLVRRQ